MPVTAPDGQRDQETDEQKWLKPVPLTSLAYYPKLVQCPACLRLAKTSVVNKLTNMPYAIGVTSALILLSGCLLAPLACVFSGSLFSGKARHATHFCERCGIRLAHWHGDTIVCAKAVYLSDATTVDGPSEVLAQAASRWANSPRGAPPPYGARLFAASIPGSPDQSLLRRTVKIERTGDGFITGVTDTQTSNTVLRVTSPTLETKEWFDGHVFAPCDPVPEFQRLIGEPAPRDAVPSKVFLYRRRDAENPAITLGFHRRCWTIDVLYYPERDKEVGGDENFFPPHRKLVHEDFPCFAHQLFFPFMSDLGPLVWTERATNGKEVETVLLDAYSRTVAFYGHDGLLSVYSTANVTEAVVEQVAAALVAVMVQRVRIQDWETASANERAASS